jgi:hypothetical protein
MFMLASKFVNCPVYLSITICLLSALRMFWVLSWIQCFKNPPFCIKTFQDLEGECCLSLLGLLRSNLNLISFPLVSLKLLTECFNNL